MIQMPGASDWTKPLDRVFSRFQDWGVPAPLLAGVAIVCVSTSLLLVVQGVINLLGWLDSTVHNWLAGRALARVSQLGVPLDGAPPILSIVVRRDEARGWLRGISAVAETPNVTRAKLAGLVSKWVVLAYLIGGVAIRKLVVENDRFSKGVRDAFDVLTGASLFIGAFLLFVVLLALPFLVIGVSALVRWHRYGFGEKLLDNLIKRTDITRTPNNVLPAADLIELELSEELRRGRGLRHSLIYQDSKVVKIIADWLEEKRVTTDAGEF